jgi:hypothetical protein
MVSYVYCRQVHETGNSTLWPCNVTRKLDLKVLLWSMPSGSATVVNQEAEIGFLAVLCKVCARNRVVLEVKSYTGLHCYA